MERFLLEIYWIGQAQWYYHANLVVILSLHALLLASQADIVSNPKILFRHPELNHVRTQLTRHNKSIVIHQAKCLQIRITHRLRQQLLSLPAPGLKPTGST